MITCTLLAGSIFLGTGKMAVQLSQVTTAQIERTMIQSRLILGLPSGQTASFVIEDDLARMSPALVIADCIERSSSNSTILGQLSE